MTRQPDRRTVGLSDCRGAALLLVLWLLVLLIGLVAVTLGGTRTGSAAGRNRLQLLRGEWAREACIEILIGRAAGKEQWEPESLALDSVDLGQGIWCRAQAEDPGERIQLNLAERSSLVALLKDSALVDRIISRRPWLSEEAVRDLPELADQPSPSWLTMLTTRGTGRVNLNRAPTDVLQTLPGLDAEGARALVRARDGGQAFRSLDEALRFLPPSAQQRFLAQYQAFANRVTLSSEQLIVHLSGQAGVGPLAARATVTLMPAGTRLAVIRRETE